MESSYFAYFYFMKNEPDKIRAILSAHIAYWNNNRSDCFSGGPFTDKSGGLIVFKAQNLASAKKLAQCDPFVVNDAIQSQWIKQWIPEL